MQAARVHYERATTAFDLQRYGEAAREYELAYEAKPDAALLFNIGQSYRLARDSARAIRAYMTFLSRVPNASNRGEVQKRINEMRHQLIEASETREKPPTGTIPPVEPLPQSAPAPKIGGGPSALVVPATSLPTAATRPNGRAHTAGVAALSLLGAGVAAMAAGAGLLGSASALHLDAGATLGDQDVLTARQRTLNISGGVLVGVGGLALVGSAVAFGVWYRERSRVTVAFVPSPSGAVLIFGGAW